MVQPQEIIGIGRRGERLDLRAFFVGQIEKAIGLAADLGDDQIAQLGENAARDLRDVVPLVGEVGEDGEEMVHRPR